MKPIGSNDYPSVTGSYGYTHTSPGAASLGTVQATSLQTKTGSGLHSNLSPKAAHQLGKPLMAQSGSPLMRQLATLQKQGLGQMILQPVLHPGQPELQVQPLQHSLQGRQGLVEGQKRNVHEVMEYRDMSQPRQQQPIYPLQGKPMTIDVTTKTSMRISEVGQRAQETTTPHTAYFHNYPEGSSQARREKIRKTMAQNSVLAPSTEENVVKIQEKRLSRIFKSRPGRLSPHAVRGNTALTNSTKDSGLLELNRGLNQTGGKRGKNKKYEDIRSKLEGYHNPVQLLKKMEDLEKKIRDQKKEVETLKNENTKLKDENERNKSINKKLFEEMTTLDDDSPRNDMSVSTMLMPGPGDSIGAYSAVHGVRGASLSSSMQGNVYGYPQFPQIQKQQHLGASQGQRKHSRVSTIGELHSIYQDLFLTDMKKEMSRAKDQLVHFRQQSSGAQKEIDSLKKSNYSLSSTVKRYRKMMQQMQSVQLRKASQQLSAPPGHVDDFETRSMHSQVTESVPSIHMNLIGEKQQSKSFAPSVSIAERTVGGTTTVSAAMIESAKLEKFDKAITALSKDNLWLMDILVSFLIEVKSIMRCQFVNAFIFDQHFSKLLRDVGMSRKEQENLHLQKLFFDGSWIDVICISEGDFHEPTFHSDNDVRYGIINPSHVVEPIRAYANYNLENATDVTGVEIATGIRQSSHSQNLLVPGGVLGGPVKSQAEAIWMGIQCVGKQSGATEMQSEKHKAKHAGGKGFHRVDSLLLKVLCNWLSQRIQVWLTSKENIAKERVVQNAIEMTSFITVQKTHKHMIVTMKRLIPGFFGFYDCGILVYNPESNDLFTVSDSSEETTVMTGGKHKSSAVSIASVVTEEQKQKMSDETGVKSRLLRKIKEKRDSTSSFNESVLDDAAYTRMNQSLVELQSHIQQHEIITFPSSIGVTGYVFKNKSIYYSNKPAKDAKWNPDIDNLSTAGDVRNFMIGALLDTQNRPVGVVQLINKKDDKPISEIDQARFEKMRKFLGICFENTNITHLTLGITTGVKDIMNDVMRKFESVQNESDKLGVSPISSLEKHLDLLRRKITDLNERKVNI